MDELDIILDIMSDDDFNHDFQKNDELYYDEQSDDYFFPFGEY